MPEKVLVTREIPEAGLRLLDGYDVTVLYERHPEHDELLGAVREHEGYVTGETLATSLDLGDAAGAEATEIDGRELLIGVRRA